MSTGGGLFETNREIVFTLKFKNQAGAVIRKFGTQLKGLGTKAKKASLGLKKLGDSFKRLADKAARAGAKLRSAGAAIREAGTQMTFALGAPLAAVIGFTIKSFAELELAMRGVQKTVDAPLSAIENLKQEFIGVSNTIPTAATELARMGQVAGQLGVGVEEIGAFTRVIAEFVVATDVGAEEAAFSLARIANIMQIPTSQTRNLASSMVALGNSFAANEPEIIAMSLRIAKAGKVVGLTAGEVLGFSSALASVGVKAQAGGTAISKAFIGINKAVNAGGKKLALFADIAGMSIDEFTRLFREDAATAFSAFISGLEGTRKAGGDVFKVLEDLGLQSIRTQQALLGLMLANDTLTDSLALGNRAFKENTALSREAAIFFAAIANQMKILWNQIKNAAAIMGEAFSPVLESVIKKMSEFAMQLQEWGKRLQGLDPDLKRTIALIAGLVIAAGPMLILIGAFTQLIGFAIAGVVKFGAALKTTFAFFLTSPMGLFLLAITAVIALLVTFRNELFTIGDDTARLRDYMVAIWQIIWEKIKLVGENIVGLFTWVGDQVGGLFGDSMDKSITDLTTAFNVFKAIGNSIIQLFQIVGLVIGQTFRILWDFVADGFKEVWESIKKTGGAVIKFMSGDVFGAIKDMMTPVETSPSDNLIENFKRALDGIGAILESDPLGDKWKVVGKRAGSLYAEFLAKGFTETKALEKALGSMAPLIEEIAGDTGAAAAKTFAEEFNIGFKNAFDEYLAGAKDIAKQSEDAFANAFQGMEDSLMSFLETGKFGFKEFAKSIIADFARIGVKSMLADIMAMAGGGKPAEEGFAGGIGGMFGALFSGGKAGAGTEGESTGATLSTDATAIVGAVAADTEASAGWFAGLGTSLSGLGTTFMSGLDSLGTTLGGLFSSIGGFFSEGGGGSQVLGTAMSVLSAFASEGGISDTLNKKGMVPASAFNTARRFAQGGVTSGTDKIPALLSPNEAVIPLSRNRAVPIEGNIGGSTTVNISVQASDVESFKQSSSQMLARFGNAVIKARRKTM